MNTEKATSYRKLGN